MNGFAPLIEFEFPTRSCASRINTLVGFTTSLGASTWAFNQVVHYDPKEDTVDGSVAYQLPVTVRKDFSRQVVFGPDFDWKR